MNRSFFFYGTEDGICGHRVIVTDTIVKCVRGQIKKNTDGSWIYLILCVVLVILMQMYVHVQLDMYLMCISLEAILRNTIPLLGDKVFHYSELN